MEIIANHIFQAIYISLPLCRPLCPVIFPQFFSRCVFLEEFATVTPTPQIIVAASQMNWLTPISHSVHNSQINCPYYLLSQAFSNTFNNSMHHSAPNTTSSWCPPRFDPGALENKHPLEVSSPQEASFTPRLMWRWLRQSELAVCFPFSPLIQEGLVSLSTYPAGFPSSHQLSGIFLEFLILKSTIKQPWIISLSPMGSTHVDPIALFQW